MTNEQQFLPNNYSVPKPAGNYMKLAKGENRFRVLAPAIVGYLGWKETEDGGRTPLRRHMDDQFEEADGVDEVKHFWAMPVWNYAQNRVQILEISQATVQEQIATLANDSDWGNPTQYDIVVNRTGDLKKTKYSVVAKPKAPISNEVAAAWDAIKPTFNLDVLFDGGDPFDTTGAKSKPRAGQDIATTLKAIFASARKAWPTLQAAPDPKEALKKRLEEDCGIIIASFSEASLEQLTATYGAIQERIAKNNAETMTEAAGGDEIKVEDIPF